MKKLKLNKNLLNYSRREVDKLIKENRIKINENIAILGQEIKLGDKIKIDENEIINWEEIVRLKNELPSVSSSDNISLFLYNI